MIINGMKEYYLPVAKREFCHWATTTVKQKKYMNGAFDKFHSYVWSSGQ